MLNSDPKNSSKETMPLTNSSLPTSFFSGVNRGLANYLAMTGIALGGLSSAEKSDAAIFKTGTTNQQTLDMGAQFQGKILFLRQKVDSVGSNFASVTFYNSKYGLTAKHSITGVRDLYPSKNIEISVGDNLNYRDRDEQGNIRGNIRKVVGVILHPTLDLAILKFESPLFCAANQTIAPVNTYDRVFQGGYGDWGTPGSTLTRTGDLRVGDARVMDSVIGGSAPYYQSTAFGYLGAYGQGLQLESGLKGGDSGGGIFDEQGRPVGVAVGAPLGNDSTSSTTYVCLGEPTTKAWIESNAPTPPPELQLSINGNDKTVSWDQNAVGWKIQISNDLNAWNNFGSVITGAGSQTFNGSDLRQFYRLVK